MQLQLGTKIRQLRHRDGRTQETLAEALGVTSQAVSRWESGGSYPDMNLIPSIANYFGVTIDELFGYQNDRLQKVETLVSQIQAMIAQNNGVDHNMTECIALAREAMMEFPGNEKIMLCLASALYQAGYVWHGEYHLIDEDGYSVYDAGRHREYAEWREAISLYEKLLQLPEAGEVRHQAVRELTQLYLNMGEHERAQAVASSAPGIYDSREFLRIKACDGKRQAAAYGEALLQTIRACAELMIGGIIANARNLTAAEKAKNVWDAIGLFAHVCTDGNYGVYHAFVARLYTFLSLYLWLDQKCDEAFEALEQSLLHYRKFEQCRGEQELAYTAPLIRLVKIDHSQTGGTDDSGLQRNTESLAEDWPWWNVPEASQVKCEMQSDPRWNAWIERIRA